LETRTAKFCADIGLFDVTSRSVFSVARRVKTMSPDMPIVAVAVPEVADQVLACVDAGFCAYVPRNASPSELLDTVERALRGETLCDPRIARTLFDELARRRPVPTHGSIDALTPREIEIAKLLGIGTGNREIAAQLHLSVATIKNHVHSVLHKLHVERRSQVAQLLIETPEAFRGR
jgi:DNA-binding NarL/FixJ family response regulator